MSRLMLAPIVCLSAITLAITVSAQWLFSLALRASEQLINPGIYIDAVLKTGPRP
jgi:formate hydrogenlyase subunit 3/multisubunit Na+/H+ antiporter MnhD subunit